MSVLEGKSVFCTGGSGSFGQAFVRRALIDGARRVVVYSRSESKQADMRAAFTDPRLRYFIGDCRDEQRLTQAMRGVDIVAHAAALKRIEICESDPAEAIATNVSGTLAVARAADACDVERCVLLSTDKAASPNTLYGASKLAAERLWNASNVYTLGRRSRYACTRYGNVIASTGSVVPLWRAQAAAGKPLTITDIRMTRFLMPMRAAVDLVVTALTRMIGGEVFVPVLRSARMVDLAWAVSHSPTENVGIRSGEKLHETLVTEDEMSVTEDVGDLLIIRPGSSPSRTLERSAYRSDAGPYLTVEELQAMIA